MPSERQTLCTGGYLRLMRIDNWEYAERMNICGIVGIAAVTDDDELIMVEQYRAPLGKRVIELPAGLAGDIAGTEGEDLLDAAKRELLEETGYSASTITLICEGPPSAGTTNEIITMYLARGLKKVGEGGGDHSEDITVHTVPIKRVHPWLEEKRREGLLIDLRIYTGSISFRTWDCGPVRRSLCKDGFRIDQTEYFPTLGGRGQGRGF